jgi:putative transposase
MRIPSGAFLASSPTLKTFLENHAGEIISIDFFTVPTITFGILFCFVVLKHNRRQIVHFNVTAHPTACWTGQQMIQAFPEDTAPRYLLRDQDKTYGADFTARVRALGIQEVRAAPASPWQRAYVERVIASIRRECLDHVIVLDQSHLRAVLRSYLTYYHETRPHLSLERNSPFPREVDPPGRGRVISVPQVGGLHQRYHRCA